MSGRLLHDRRIGYLLAVFRIAVGLFFAMEAAKKIQHGWLVGSRDFVRSVQGYDAARSPGIYHAFVTQIVLAHSQLFAALIALGECCVAISLTFGILTRAGALLGLCLNANFILLRDLSHPAIDVIFVPLEVVFLLFAAGRFWGMDGFWRERLSRPSVTRWLSGNDMATPTEPVSHRISL